MKSAVTLKKNSDFRRIYSKGRSSSNPYIVIYCRKNGLSTNRTGYTVSKKLGNAVTRNRVRRRLREIYRLNREKLGSGWDIITVARSRAVGAAYADLDAAFLKACTDLGILL